jgi:hypothetical protein
MKKIILYIGSVVFTALMGYNIGAGNLLAKSSDVSLESIKIMAAAAEDEDPGGGYGNWKYGFCYSGCIPYGIEIICYWWPNSLCNSTPCTAGWCN